MTPRIALPLLTSMVLLLAGCGPMGPMPGGALDGAATPPPRTWDTQATAEIVQLETQPSDPYSVNIWGVALAEHYYVAAGGGETTWTAHIAADPNVRLKVGDSLFELRASLVEDAEERAAVGAAYEAKYEMTDEQREGASVSRVYRLDRRS